MEVVGGGGWFGGGWRQVVGGRLDGWDPVTEDPDQIQNSNLKSKLKFKKNPSNLLAKIAKNKLQKRLEN
jgi:hypothetical protein